MASQAPAQQLVTVFGGSGFVGRHVVRALVKRGYRVRVAVRRPDLANFLQPIGIVGESDYEHPEYDLVSPEGKRSLANLLHFEQSQPDFISWNHKDLPSAAPYFCRSMLGLPVMSWTVRSAEAAAKVAPHINQIVFENFLPG